MQLLTGSTAGTYTETDRDAAYRALEEREHATHIGPRCGIALIDPAGHPRCIYTAQHLYCSGRAGMGGLVWDVLTEIGLWRSARIEHGAWLRRRDHRRVIFYHQPQPVNLVDGAPPFRPGEVEGWREPHPAPRDQRAALFMVRGFEHGDPDARIVAREVARRLIDAADPGDELPATSWVRRARRGLTDRITTAKHLEQYAELAAQLRVRFAASGA